MLAGAASFALVASAQPAAAADGQTYVMMLQMPTGAVEHIQYTGDVPPQIVLSAPAMIAPMVPLPAPVWEPSFATSYATLARMTAILEEQEAAQEAAMARLATATPAAATFENLPAGAVTYISTYVSDGACTRTTQITYSSEGVAPRTVSDTSGDRGAAPAARAPAEVRLPAAHHHTAPSARLIEARANGAHLAPGLLHEAVWRP
jgi:hypothetical protein